MPATGPGLYPKKLAKRHESLSFAVEAQYAQALNLADVQQQSALQGASSCAESRIYGIASTRGQLVRAFQWQN